MSLPDYKSIVELVKKGLTIEAQEKIMELRVAALEIQEENIRLRTRLLELEEQAKTSANLVFDNELYWIIQNGDKRDGPFCPVCHDNENKRVRLHSGRDRVARSDWVCLTCKHTWGHTDELPSSGLI